MNKISVVIVDDIEEIVNYFKMILSKEADIEVVNTASSGEEAYQVVIDCRPDIVLMDIEMESDFSGIKAIQRIKEKIKGIKIILLTIHEDDELLFQAYAAGAMDYIVKTSSIVDIINSIRNVYNNELSMRPETAGKILAEFSRLKSQQNSMIFTLNIISMLTNAELEIIKALYNGNSYKQIAKERYVEEVTIRTQINKILKKFDSSKMKDVIRELKELKIFDTYDFLK